MLQHLADDSASSTRPRAARVPAILGALAATLFAVAGVMTVRAALSLSEAGDAFAAGDSLAAVQALDRCLAEAPPFASPIRRRAVDELERVALDDSDPVAAWYATLFLVSASPTDERSRWLMRSLELAPPAPHPGAPATPLIPVDTTAPSYLWSAVAGISLVSWIGLLAAWLAAPWRWARSPRAAVAAAILWLLWLAAVISA